MPNYDMKAKNFKETFQKTLKFNKKYLPLLLIALILSFLSSILAIIGPDKLREITDIISQNIMGEINLVSIRNISIVLLILYLLSFAFNYIQGYLMAIVTNKFSKNMRGAIEHKINKLPLSYFDKTTIGDILSRVINDVDTVSWALNQSLGTLVNASTMFIGSIVMMFYTNTLLAVISIASALIGFILLSIIMKKSQKYFRLVQKGLGDINGQIEEVFSGINIVNVYNANEEVTKKFDEINDELFDSSLKSQFYSGLMHPIMGFVGNLGYVLVCVVGVILTIKGTISFGVIVAFMIYIRLFTQPLTQFAQGFTNLQSSISASERVFEFLDAEEMDPELSRDYIYLNPGKVVGNLEFSDVSFGYEKDKKIIKKFNTIVKSGEKVAIVGPTGAGKTTIVNLLMKFYDIDEGDIKIDGVSIKNIKRKNIHDLFTMVLQDTWVFSGTIKENIKYNKKNVSDEEVIKVCKIVGLDHFIRTLPLGYDTIMSEIGEFSSGQKQLLTIARSMIEDTPFLILDEATSNVDTRTEKLVTKAMEKLAKGKTCFIIAHRLSTIKDADLILVMKDGKLCEYGTHDELLNKKGFYEKLYNSQFQN